LIKTVFKIAIALAIINAAFHAGDAYWRYYQLEDAVEQLITFGSQEHTNELHTRMVQKAEELRVPLLPEDIAVHREGKHTFVEGGYTQPIEYFPNMVYRMEMKLFVENYSLNPGRPEDPPER
jgi:hypothetical protein